MPLDLSVDGRIVREDQPGGAAVGASLRRTFGLEPKAPLAWVLQGRDGQVLASGYGLPEPDGLATVLESAGEHSSVAFLKRFRSWSAKDGGGATPEQDPGAEGGQAAAWEAYAAVLAELLLDPLGTLPEALRRAEIHVPGQAKKNRRTLPSGMEALARRVMPCLEAELTRWPTDKELWRVWLSLAPHLEQFPLALLERLAPSPTRPPEAWPPEGVLEQAAAGLKAQCRWGELAGLLLPHLEQRRKVVDDLLQTRNGKAMQGCRMDWSWELAEPLLEALVHQGQTREADAMMELMVKAGDHPGPHALFWLSGMADEAGESAFSQKWLARAMVKP